MRLFNFFLTGCAKNRNKIIQKIFENNLLRTYYLFETLVSI